MEIKNWLDVLTSIVSLIGVFFFVYLYFRSPDEKAEKQLSVLNTNCILKHTRIDEIIREMKDSFKSIDSLILLIKENDIKHIETEMRRMSEAQTRILTILEYKEKTKIDS